LQASGSRLTFFKTARILYQEEGLLRFWKGAQVIASGCIPAHASYFTVYELLKRYFHYENEQYEILHTAMIGAMTTFAHDFFITPSDSKIFYFITIHSD
jgi:solute carrier family 25 (mitochondrial iron transporter), member 28/37